MTTSFTMDDIPARRRWRRYHFAAPVRVTIEKSRRTTLIETHACALNDGGISINTNADLSLGTPAKIQFLPPSFELPLTLRGVVCNRKGRHYGVEFMVTNAVEKEHLILFQELLHAKVGCLDA
jgi:hypothetical protein